MNNSKLLKASIKAYIFMLITILVKILLKRYKKLIIVPNWFVLILRMNNKMLS
jgi:hypothetical protein